MRISCTTRRSFTRSRCGPSSKPPRRPSPNCTKVMPTFPRRCMYRIFPMLRPPPLSSRSLDDDDDDDDDRHALGTAWLPQRGCLASHPSLGLTKVTGTILRFAYLMTFTILRFFRSRNPQTYDDQTYDPPTMKLSIQIHPLKLRSIIILQTARWASRYGCHFRPPLAL